MTATKNPGFSLLEIMIAIAIMALLAVTLGPKLLNVLGKAKDSKVNTELQVLKHAIEEFYADTNQYPHRLEDLIKKPADQNLAKKWRRPYVDDESATIKEDRIVDPWDNPYIYRVTKGAAHPFELYSEGDPETPGRLDAWKH